MCLLGWISIEYAVSQLGSMAIYMYYRGCLSVRVSIFHVMYLCICLQINTTVMHDYVYWRDGACSDPSYYSCLCFHFCVIIIHI